MSTTVWGGLLGAVAGVGLVLVVLRISVLRRPQLSDRVLPYLRDLPMRDQGPALRTLSSDASASTGVEASVNKLLWATWHRRLGEVAMHVAGPEALLVDGELSPLQNLFLFTRSDTIYGGSNEVQRNVIAERHWKLPRDTWTSA